MYNVLVSGVDTTECDTWGGILDIEIESPTPDEAKLINFIAEAFAEKEATGCVIGSARVDRWYNVEYQKIPFTGTIHDEVILYLE